MPHLMRIVVVLATLVQLSQTHPTLALFRITRDANNVPVIEAANAAAGEETELLLANINSGSSQGADFVEVPRALVELERPQAILINIAYPGGEEDLVLAETQIFRPLFTYRQQIAKRQRVKKLVDGKK